MSVANHNILSGSLVLVEDSDSGSEVIEVLETRSLLNSTVVGQWVSVDGLQAYSNYSVAVRACNSQGCLESPPVPVSLPPGGKQTPDPLIAPYSMHWADRIGQVC